MMQAGFYKPTMQPTQIPTPKPIQPTPIQGPQTPMQGVAPQMPMQAPQGQAMQWGGANSFRGGFNPQMLARGLQSFQR